MLPPHSLLQDFPSEFQLTVVSLSLSVTITQFRLPTPMIYDGILRSKVIIVIFTVKITEIIKIMTFDHSMLPRKSVNCNFYRDKCNYH